MTATLRDVAAKANVSTSTVSRVLNNKTTTVPISEETRQRVLQAIQDVGYKPNIAARQLARKQSIALICTVVPLTVPTVLNHPFYMSVVHGIARTCQSQGYAVAIYFADTNNPHLQTVEQDYSRILEIPAHGVILTNIHRDDRFIPRLAADNIPFVHIGRLPGVTSPNTRYVDVDNYAGAQLAIRHLLDKGHHRIATITGDLSMSAGLDRLRGYQEAMAQANLATPAGWIVEADFEREQGYLGMKQLLTLDSRPTAVFAASDSMAIGAIQAIQEQGLTVPGDIALVGFDDIPEAAHMTPALTTIRQPTALLGEKAAEMLLAMVADLPQPTNLILQPQLIIRETT